MHRGLLPRKESMILASSIYCTKIIFFYLGSKAPPVSQVSDVDHRRCFIGDSPRFLTTTTLGHSLPPPPLPRENVDNYRGGSKNFNRWGGLQVLPCGFPDNLHGRSKERPTGGRSILHKYLQCLSAAKRMCTGVYE